MEWLLSIGVPWNALDKKGHCAGDYTEAAGHENVTQALVSAGCRAERILSALERPTERHTSAEDAFLKEDIVFETSCILDAKGDAVMMQWEKPLMEAHAEALCVRDGDVLNVGFGMGLVDDAIQRRQPKSHTIIEAHPQIHARMIDEGWDRRPGVRVLCGRWQDVIEDLSGFDAVFFDTYGEHYSDLQDFHRHLPRLLKPDGLYSFFNGLAPDNAFFHRVYCEIVKDDLSILGLTTQFVSLPLNANSDEIWKHVCRRYWYGDVYHLPIAQMHAPSL